jgi:hypothetical protein
LTHLPFSALFGTFARQQTSTFHVLFNSYEFIHIVLPPAISSFFTSQQVAYRDEPKIGAETTFERIVVTASGHGTSSP